MNQTFRIGLFLLVYVTSLFLMINCHKELVEDHDLPIIIWWTESIFPHEKQIAEIKCPKSRCLSTSKKNVISKIPTRAFVFYGSDFDAVNLPLPRKGNDLWALLHEESPMNNFIFSHTVGVQLFNYTSTFSRYSDFPVTSQHIPSLSYLSEKEPVPLSLKNRLRNRGFAPVLYVQSHCNVASDRDRYVKELMKYIDIDSYGKCLHNKDIPPYLSSTETRDDDQFLHFIAQYKFHLAFENSICEDYITEKLFRALHVGSIPVYKGSPTVKDWIPSNTSVVVADDFSSPRDLAAFIYKLDQDDNLYNNYLSYKNKGGITNLFLQKTVSERSWNVNEPDSIDFVKGFECFVCDKIFNLSEVVQSRKNVKETNKKHLSCPQPHPAVDIENRLLPTDAWIQQDWEENYWFAYDQARAIQLMIDNRENSSSNFLHYVLKFKYQH